MLTDHLHQHSCPGGDCSCSKQLHSSAQRGPEGLKKHCNQLPPFITEQGDLQPPAKHMEGVNKGLRVAPMDLALHLMLMRKQLLRRCSRRTAQLPRPVGLAKAVRKALIQNGEKT